ncbi:hypothetical protein ACS0TY_003184 [Phlomoides rotata]
MYARNWILKAPTTSNAKAPTISNAQDMMHKIHVLLVDHDSSAHAATVDIFESFSYKVTSVRLASSAVSILSNGKKKVDLLVENINSPDFGGYKLLQIALQMDMPVILLLDEDDLVFTKRALETGVLLCIKKPVPVEIARYLWQLVAREKIRKEKEMGRFRELATPKRLHNGVREEDDLVKGCSSGNTGLNKQQKCPETANQEDNNIIFKQNFWTEWTQDLHERFVYAIRKLGKGRCYPSDILELMNVPGLTRMQVARHLQKCRNDRWVPPHQRKTVKQVYEEVIPTQPCPDKRSFGSMPLIDDDVIDQLPPNQNPDLNLQEFAAFEPTVEAPIMGYDGINQNNINGAFNMGKLGQIGQGFDMDDESIYGVAGQALTPIDAPWNDVAFGDAFAGSVCGPYDGSGLSSTRTWV